AMYGVAIDALVSQFVVGEIEDAVIEAFKNEKPDIILVEGQSAVSHPAFMGSLGILKGSKPDGVILQHPPARKYRCDFPNLKMPAVESEIDLIETISQTKVMAIALSHENLSDQEILGHVAKYEQRFQLPTTDVLSHGCIKLVQTLCKHFPELGQKIKRKHVEKIRALAA
ncbi:MAG: NAD-dependent epimerase/dehydratase family protein, partial [Desulfobacterales bacterium]|nr:NAD-dependent epimerase/dehydratase family protein [Desulfobacterales bacterium]